VIYQNDMDPHGLLKYVGTYGCPEQPMPDNIRADIHEKAMERLREFPSQRCWSQV
jgi:hypothetical protein